jgi:Raf kinase inhibitor-like YbhB/YbcL family protein
MGMFPAGNAGQGGSPAISWTGTPAGTQSFVLLLHDPDPVQNGNNVDVTHWLIYNIPGTATGLPANVAAGAAGPDGSVQAPNITTQPSYMGPGPPAGNGPHHYTFELYALSAKLDVPAGADRNAVMAATAGKVLAKGVFVATFENK